ncbi:MAG: carboxypeptidase-like regulatory domain-containing protein [Marinilabiliaceae bacterium]|nr:carboxypeptidase-like regulatory domain-containing protein [Marinilabiliaceae bacterium]
MINKYCKYIFNIICSFCILIPSTITAQQKNISGVVIDATNNDPIPMANIYIKNTTIGTTSNIKGQFSLINIPLNDSLIISSLGFKPRSIHPKNCNENLKITLIPVSFNVNEIKVIPKDDRIKKLLNDIDKHRNFNNPDKIERYSYEKYTKWDYTLNNVDNSLMKSKTFKNKQSLFKKLSNGKHYLPVYFSEQITKHEFQQNPTGEKTVIEAENTSGLGVMDHLEISGYTASLESTLNFYNNYVRIYNRNYVSPLSSNGWFYYRYYIEDSVKTDNNWKYKVLYYPRRKEENVFKGYFYINDKHFNLTYIDATLSDKNQLNFLKSMHLTSEYQLINDSVSFLKTNCVEATFDYLPTNYNTQKDRFELGYKRNCSISNVKVDELPMLKLSNNGLSYEYEKSSNAALKDSNYWETKRHIKLSSNDLLKTAIIDSVNNINRIKVMNNTLEMGLTSFYDIGKFEWGPYPDFVTFNKIEGLRLYAGGRTSSEISNNWMLYGGLGYGLKSHEISGQFGAGYKFNGNRRKIVLASFDDRYIKIGENMHILHLKENMLRTSETNLISSFFNRDEFDELYRQQSAQLTYSHEWKTGFSSSLKSCWKKQYSPKFYPFINQSDSITDIQTIEATCELRFSWKEKFIDKGYRRLYLSSNYPIINMSFSAGQAYLGNEHLPYAKVHATCKHSFFLGQTQFKTAFEAGHIFGKLPYTLLNIPRGNETYGLYLYNFNMINYLEFVHDTYFHSFFEYHLNGFFFNRIPLLKKLGLREVLSAKGMIGQLSEKQKNSMNLPDKMGSSTEPYSEVGAGIENLLRFFRLEVLWRSTPSVYDNIPKFGFRAKFEIKL